MYDSSRVPFHCFCFLFYTIILIYSSYTLSSARGGILLDINNDLDFRNSVIQFYESRSMPLYVFPNNRIEFVGVDGAKDLWVDIHKYFSMLSMTNLDLIISGHHSGGEFSGENGRIIVNKLKILDGDLKLTPRIDRIYFDGCYTATLELVRSGGKFGRTFPNVRAILGYEGQSPSKTQRVQAGATNEALQLLETVDHKQSYEQLSKSLKTLRNWKSLSYAIYTRSNYSSEWKYIRARDLQREGATSPARELQVECASQFHHLNWYSNRSRKFFFGEEPIPKNTKQSELRQIYDWSRRWEHCQIFGDWVIPTHLEPDRIIRLIYWDNIVSNFEKRYLPITQSSANTDYKNTFNANLPGVQLENRAASLAEVIDFASNLSRQKLSRRLTFDVLNELREFKEVLIGVLMIDPGIIPLDWALSDNSHLRLLITPLPREFNYVN